MSRQGDLWDSVGRDSCTHRFCEHRKHPPQPFFSPQLLMVHYLDLQPWMNWLTKSSDGKGSKERLWQLLIQIWGESKKQWTFNIIQHHSTRFNSWLYLIIIDYKNMHPFMPSTCPPFLGSTFSGAYNSTLERDQGNGGGDGNLGTSDCNDCYGNVMFNF